MKPSFIKLFTCLFLLSLFVTFSVVAQVQTARYVSMDNSTKGYYEYLPDGYGNDDTQTYPLLLSLHGIGNCGNGRSELYKVLGTNPAGLIDKGTFPTSFTVNNQTFKFIIITPQFSYWPNSSDIESVLNYIVKHYKVDLSRIYLTGYSMGGGVTWDYASDNSTNAKRLAAIVPICGASLLDASSARIITAANLPVWATHNDEDPTVPVNNTLSNIFNINLAPAPTPIAKKTVFSSTQHNAWTQTYDPNFREDGLNIYEWMLQYQRGNNTRTNLPPKANAGANQTITLPVDNATLTGTGTDADGQVVAYEWNKVGGPDGGIISDTTFAQTSVTGLTAGTYLFELIVKDNQGAIGRDTMQLIVSDATNQAPQVNAGDGQTIVLPVNSVTLNGSASDQNGVITSYTWTQVSGPSAGTIVSDTTIQTTVTDLVQGTYVFQLQVTDNGGAVSKDTVAIIVKSGVSTSTNGSTTKYIKVAVYGGADAYTGTDWNNWNVGTAAASNITSSNLSYSDGSNSAVTTTLSHTSGIGDNRSTYKGGMAPSGVLRHTSYSNQSRTLTVNGLDPNKLYNLELYASRYSTGNYSVFSVNGIKTIIAVYDNHNRKAAFTDISPTADGQIVIGISKLYNYSHLNGFMLTEQGSDYNAPTATAQQNEVMSEQPSDITPIAAPTSLEVFPNPVQSQFVLRLNNSFNGNIKVQVIDMNGSIKKEYKLSKTQSNFQQYLSAGELAAGTYILKVQMGDKTETKKIVKL